MSSTAWTLKLNPTPQNLNPETHADDERLVIMGSIDCLSLSSLAVVLWSRCSVLQCVAVCFSVLQCVAVCWSVLEGVAVVVVRCGVLKAITVCCSVLQCAAVCCSVLQCAGECCSCGSTLWCVKSHYSVLQCVAVCCSIDFRFLSLLTVVLWSRCSVL